MDDTAAATTPNPRPAGDRGDEAWFDKLTMTNCFNCKPALSLPKGQQGSA